MRSTPPVNLNHIQKVMLKTAIIALSCIHDAHTFIYARLVLRRQDLARALPHKAAATPAPAPSPSPWRSCISTLWTLGAAAHGSSVEASGSTRSRVGSSRGTKRRNGVAMKASGVVTEGSSGNSGSTALVEPSPRRTKSHPLSLIHI